jgi:hypothetical protein
MSEDGCGFCSSWFICFTCGGRGKNIHGNSPNVQRCSSGCVYRDVRHVRTADDCPRVRRGKRYIGANAAEIIPEWEEMLKKGEAAIKKKWEERYPGIPSSISYDFFDFGRQIMFIIEQIGDKDGK